MMEMVEFQSLDLIAQSSSMNVCALALCCPTTVRISLHNIKCDDNKTEVLWMHTIKE